MSVMKYIDLHCDTLMQAFLAGQKDIVHLESAMVDLERLQKGCCMAQFFAIFMPPVAYRAKLGDALPDDETYISSLTGILKRTIQLHSDVIALAASRKELEENQQADRISAILTLEDGRAVAGDLSNLERFYQMGIRLISLTWNDANCFGAPNSLDPAVMNQGLTPFGKEAVSRMNELGILVDVSHLSDGGFWDVVQLTKEPFVASHSNCRSLSPHSRNLTDEMIRAVADSGGVVGINFGPEFLAADLQNRESTVDLLVAHAKHLASTGGIGCVALGTDFDGITGTFETGEPEKLQVLFYELLKAGFSEAEVEQIAFKNALRVITDILK